MDSDQGFRDRVHHQRRHRRWAGAWGQCG
jgi:hypothetical protein